MGEVTLNQVWWHPDGFRHYTLLSAWLIFFNTSPYLEVCVFVIECDVDGECGGIMMGPQVCLSLRRVFYHKVHYSVTLGWNAWIHQVSWQSVYLWTYSMEKLSATINNISQKNVMYCICENRFDENFFFSFSFWAKRGGVHCLSLFYSSIRSHQP